KEQFRAWRKTIRFGVHPPHEPSFGIFADCYASGSELMKAEAQLCESLDHELSMSRKRLAGSARAFLPRYLVFANAGIRQSLEKDREESERLSPRNKKIRARERHLLLYLQRVAA